MLIGQIRIFGLPEPQREVVIVPAFGRFDFVWELQKIAVEVQGAIWNPHGHHTYGTGYENDCRKYNAATQAGYHVYVLTTGMIKSGEGIDLLIELCGKRI